MTQVSEGGADARLEDVETNQTPDGAAGARANLPTDIVADAVVAAFNRGRDFGFAAAAEWLEYRISGCARTDALTAADLRNFAATLAERTKSLSTPNGNRY